MPQLPDPNVILKGAVFGTDFGTVFNADKNAPKVPDGTVKVSVIEGATLSLVKMPTDVFHGLDVHVGSEVVWYVRNSPWKMDNGQAGMSTAYVSTVTLEDLELLSHSVAVPVAAGK